MGRPINKRFLGALADGTNITINCKVGSNSVTDQGAILSQRSESKFNVDDDKTLGGNTGICTLVAKDPGNLAANEMSINGNVVATGASVFVTKLHNRTCRDSNGNRYKWSIEDDSTASLMQLVAI